MNSFQYDYEDVVKVLRGNIMSLLKSPNVAIRDLFNNEALDKSDRSVIYRFVNSKTKSISLKTACRISTILDVSIHDLLTKDILKFSEGDKPLIDLSDLSEREHLFFKPPPLIIGEKQDDALVESIYKQTMTLYAIIRNAVSFGLNENLTEVKSIYYNDPVVTEQYIAFKVMVTNSEFSKGKVPIHFLTLYPRTNIRFKGLTGDSISTRGYIRLHFNLPMVELLKIKNFNSGTDRLKIEKIADNPITDKFSVSLVLKNGQLVHKRSRIVIPNEVISEISNIAFEYQFKLKIQGSLVESQQYNFKYFPLI